MEETITLETSAEVASQWRVLFQQTANLTRSESWWQQIGIIAITVLISWILAEWIHRKGIHKRLSPVLLGERLRWSDARYLVFPAIASAFLWIGFHFLEPFFDHRSVAIRGAALVATTWFLFVLAFRILRGHWGLQILLVGLLLWATAYILNVLQPIEDVLELIALKKDDFRISLRDVLYGVALLSGLFWASRLVGRMFDQWLSKSDKLSASSKVLLGKIANISLFILAFLTALQIIGFDVTHLAFFSGALGIGIGFGSQKIISNFVSGIILLVEKSVKPGDTIRLGESYGQITRLNTRYATISAPGSQEHLIPNEKLITEEVISYSHSDHNLGLSATIGVEYGSDLDEVIRLCTDAANSVDRVCQTPPANCYLTEFGDSSINFLLCFSISDPENGIASAKSEVLLAVWRAFEANGISIPFPQREVRIVGGDDEAQKNALGK